MPEDRIISMKGLRISAEDFDQLKAIQDDSELPFPALLRLYIRLGLALDRHNIRTVSQLEKRLKEPS